MSNAQHMGEKLKQMAAAKGWRLIDVARAFDVKPPSVYDWYAHGRIAKKHYPKLLELFDKPLQWWLDIPEASKVHEARESAPSYSADERHKALVALFDALPSKEQDDLMRSLEAKKLHYDAIVDELIARRLVA